jgi:hypothetical protein
VRLKIEADIQRGSLSDYHKIWRTFGEQTQIIDVIDGQPIDMQGQEKITIDHFIPWSFIASDDVWNLTPITQTNNSSKSNKIIDLDSEIATRFVNQQWGLYEFLDKHQPKGYKGYLDDYFPVFNKASVHEDYFKAELMEVLKRHAHTAHKNGFARYG